MCVPAGLGTLQIQASSLAAFDPFPCCSFRFPLSSEKEPCRSESLACFLLQSFRVPAFVQITCFGGDGLNDSHTLRTSFLTIFTLKHGEPLRFRYAFALELFLACADTLAFPRCAELACLLQHLWLARKSYCSVERIPSDLRSSTARER